MCSYLVLYLILNILLSIYILAATAGPIKKANSNVPRPTGPPKNHPIMTTVTSMELLTIEIVRLVSFCNPVITPSIGPGPRLDIS